MAVGIKRPERDDLPVLVPAGVSIALWLASGRTGTAKLQLLVPALISIILWLTVSKGAYYVPR